MYGVNNYHTMHVSLIPRPSCQPANVMHDYFYSARKAGRSGQFCDVMMMSGGHGLAQHGHGLKNVNHSLNVGDMYCISGRF